MISGIYFYYIHNHINNFLVHIYISIQNTIFKSLNEIIAKIFESILDDDYYYN